MNNEEQRDELEKEFREQYSGKDDFKDAYIYWLKGRVIMQAAHIARIRSGSTGLDGAGDALDEWW